MWFQNRRAKFRKNERLAQQKSCIETNVITGNCDSESKSCISQTPNSLTSRIKNEDRNTRTPPTSPASTNSTDVKSSSTQNIMSSKHQSIRGNIIDDCANDLETVNSRSSGITWGSCNSRSVSSTMQPYLLDSLPLKTPNLY